MAQNVANDINYFLVVDETKKDDLANIRPWNNLKIAFEEKLIWVKDLDLAQVNSLEVKCIPFKTIYYSQHGKLYLLNSLLPERNIPNLLWTNIERALPVKLPSFNHNYFGVQQNITMRIVTSEQEMETEAMIVSIQELNEYITTAPAIRLQNLKWVLLNNDKAFIFGKPLLPITGNVYWKKQSSFIPAGSDFEFSILTESLNTILNSESENFILWDTDSTYALIPVNDLQTLSLSSFRLSLDNHLLQPSI